MSTISSLSSSSTSAVTWQREKPDSATLAADIFKKVDTDSTGTISQAELESSLKDTSSSKASSGAAILMKGLDSDSDGSISKQELTDGLQKLADQFDAQFNASRTTQASSPKPTHGGHGGTPPADGDSDASSASAVTSSTTYDPADFNQDGSVSAEERLAYQAKEADKDGGVNATSRKQHGISHMLERLTQMYGTNSTEGQGASTVSITA